MFLLVCVIGMLPQLPMENVPAMLTTDSVLSSPQDGCKELLGMKRRRRLGTVGRYDYLLILCHMKTYKT